MLSVLGYRAAGNVVAFLEQHVSKVLVREWFMLVFLADEFVEIFERFVSHTFLDGGVDEVRRKLAVCAYHVGGRTYAGGFVGFVLTRYQNNTDNFPIYYSESTRNANCTGCSAPLPAWVSMPIRSFVMSVGLQWAALLPAKAT